MRISPTVRAVFGHFQNLNLLALLEDLRQERTARQRWSTGARLCPVAHGLASGQQVQALAVMEQDADVAEGCEYAARDLGAEPAAVLRFVRSWDDYLLDATGLLRQLEELWRERLEDALVMQEFLEESASLVNS
jgi:hypothetical protein